MYDQTYTKPAVSSSKEAAGQAVGRLYEPLHAKTATSQVFVRLAFIDFKRHIKSKSRVGQGFAHL